MKKKWIAVLLALAVIFAGSGIYLFTDPGWLHENYYSYYNRGVSSSLNNEAEKAVNDFAFVAGNSNDPWLKSLAFTQMGTILGKQAFNQALPPEVRYQIAQYAVEIFKEAVISNPDNGEAKYNLELLLNQLASLSQQMKEPNQEPGYSHGSGNKGY